MTHLLHPFSRARRGGECSSFEGVYNFTPRMAHRGERHSHDHYELYIHLRGGELFSIGSELAPMEPNQLVVIPPYCMHGLIYDEPLTDYERMYLNVTPETLTAAGGGITGTESTAGRSIYTTGGIGHDTADIIVDGSGIFDGSFGLTSGNQHNGTGGGKQIDKQIFHFYFSIL